MLLRLLVKADESNYIETAMIVNVVNESMNPIEIIQAALNNKNNSLSYCEENCCEWSYITGTIIQFADKTTDFFYRVYFENCTLPAGVKAPEISFVHLPNRSN